MKQVGLALLIVLMINFTALSECSDRFCVGMLLSLSGVAQEYGQAIQNGQELAIKESPELFKDIKFIYEDSRYDSKIAVTSYLNLINQGADMIYVFGGPMSEIVGPYALRHKKITFVSGLDPKISQNNPYIFRFENSAKQYGAVLAQEVQRCGIRKIAFVLAENQYLSSIYDGFKAASSNLEISLFGPLLSGSVDFRALLTKIKSKEYDAVAVFLLPGDLSLFYKEMSKQDLKLPTFGSDVLESKSEIANAGPSIEGAFFVNHGVSTSFHDNYFKSYKQDYQIAFAATGYDLSRFLAQQFSKHYKNISIENVNKILDSAGKQVGVSGEYLYRQTADGDKFFDFPIIVRKVTQGNIVTQ